MLCRSGSLLLCLYTIFQTVHLSSCIERNVTEGDDLTLSVSVEGGSIDSVKWTVCCQGLQIVNNTKFLVLEDVLSVSLTILNVASEDSGTYTVTVTNSTQAVVVMQSFEVQVQVFPVLLEQPMSISELVQEVVHLVCKARAFPLPLITWFRNTIQIVEEEGVSIINLQGETVTSSVLTIESLSVDVAGEYRCVANNTLVQEESVTSELAVVTALYAPNVVVPVSPSPTLTVNVTDTFTINCTVFGIPLPNITWTFNQDTDPLDSTNDGITIVQSDDGNIRTSLLTFSNVSKMAEGEYVCSGQNFIENVLNTPLNGSLRLIIQVPPTINRISSSSIYAIESNSIELQFNITDDDPLVTVSNIIWTLSSAFGSEDITNSNSQHFEFSPDKLTLRIINVQVSVHSGLYTMTATNEAGTRSLSIDVLIESSPKIFIIPQDVIALEGDTVSFDCLVTGQPPPEQTWLFEDIPVTAFDLPQFTIGEEQFGSLKIYNISYEDEGMYTCIYNSSIGEIVRSAQLTVQVSPILEYIDVPSNGTAGSSVMLMCNSTGVPVPSITWLKNGSTIPSILGKSVISSLSMELESGIETIISTLQLQGLVLSDKSLYSCRADNDLAIPQTQLSDQLQLDILYPPDVSIDINSLTVNQSDQSSFTCTAFGIPLPSFMWYFNESSDALLSDNIEFSISNTMITNGSGLVLTMSTLTILNTSRSQHEGDYSCRATNGIDNLIGTPEIAEAHLIVQVPPRVLVVSEDPVGVVNRSVNISFLITEAFPLVMVDNIQWHFNYTTLLNNGTMLSIENRVFTPDLLTLTLSNIQHSDQGVYSLTATNEAGTNTAEVFLEVEAAPVITDAPKDTVQLEGQDVVFKCEAISEPLYSVMWQFNETVINNSIDKYIIDAISGDLSILSVELNDTGVYTCIVDNIHGSDTASAMLTVQVIPQFTVNPIDMAVLVIGDSVQLNCSSFAVPLSNITWLMNGSVLDYSSMTVQVSSAIEGQFNTFSELTLSQLSFNDTGSYSCMATNELASVQSSISSSAVVIVNMPVVIMESPVNSVVNETDTVEYNCVAKGLPTPTIIWSTPLQSDLNAITDVNVTVTELVNIQSPEASIVESTLRFTSIVDNDATNYTCTASNTPRDDGNIATADNTFSITVQTRPVVLYTGNGTVVGVQLRDTMLSFNISRDLPSVEVEDIRWFFTQQGTNIKKEIIATENDRYTFTSDRLTVTITQLSLNDSGVYSVEANNIVGTGRASAVLDVQKAPVIILQIEPLTQLSDSTATFICEADANPQHTIEWTKDNQQLFNSSRILITGLGTARSTLTITNIQLNDTGDYGCVAENVHGNDSTSDELFVQVPPRYVSSPSSVNLTAGANTVIECNVEGFPKPSVQLLKNNQTDTSLSYNVTNGTLANGLLFERISLTLNELTFVDSGSYSCRASNDLASLETRTSPSAIYTIQYAPNVSVSPSNIVANESDSIMLLCEVSSLPIPTIVWLNSSSPDNQITTSNDEGDVTLTQIQLPTNTSSIPVTISTLSITNVLKSHEANYTCVATNGIDNLLGTPENGTIPVTVQVPPSAIAVDGSVLGVVNESVILRFTIDRASPEVDLNNIEWSFTSNNISVDIITNSLNDNRLMLSMDLLTLTIDELRHSDEGVYTITARNPAGASTASIILSIEASPVFIIKPRDSSVLSGESVVFSCMASSVPLYSIRWERDGVPIAQYLSLEDNRDNVLAFARLNSNTTGVPVTINNTKYQLQGEGPSFGQLTITNAVLDDARTYRCVIDNFHGNLTATANLLVQVIPVFVSEFEPVVNLSVGETVTFTCNAAGQPEPNVTWYRNGILLTNMDTGVIIRETPDIRQFNASLTLTSVTRAAEGEYWCNATNFRFVRFETTSPRWEVNIYYPPNVIKFPVTLQRQAAQYAVFICSLTGFPIPTLEWTRTGTKQINTNLTGKFQIKDNAVDTSNTIGPYTIESQLTVFNLSFEDQQIYTCNGISQVDVDNFINASNNASASLFVNVPPRVVSSVDSPSIAIWGRMYTISFNILNAQPDVEPQNITWSFYPSNTNREGGIIRGSDRLVFTRDRRSLQITSVILDDDGRYEVTGSNIAGSSTATVTVNVLVEPLIDAFIPSYNGSVVDISSTVMFTCTCDGLPLPTLGWRHNGTVVTSTGRISIATDIKEDQGIRTSIPITQSITSVLTLTDVNENDHYSQWSCIGENRVGRDEQGTVLQVPGKGDPCEPNPCLNNGVCYSGDTLVCQCVGGYTGTFCEFKANIVSSPVITTPPRPVSGPLHSFVNLTCIASGNPQPNIEWYKDGVIINDAKAFQYTFELSVDSRGWYTCRAVSNLEGGQLLVESADPVLVTINNIAQYLVTMIVSTDSLHNTYGNMTNEQLLDTYITQEINPGIAGTTIGNNSVVLSVFLHQILSESNSSRLSFTTIVTVVTNRLYQQELRDVIQAHQANPSFELIDLERFDGCSSEVTSNIQWPETNLGLNATLDCPCGNLSLGAGHPTATRRCEGNFTTGALWSQSHDTSCDFNSNAKSLCEVASVSDVNTILLELSSLSSQVTSYTEVVISVALLEDRFTDLMSDMNITAKFLSTINEMIAVDKNILQEAQQTGNVSSRILMMIDRIGAAISFSNTTTYSIQQSLFSLAVFDITDEQFYFSTSSDIPLDVNITTFTHSNSSEVQNSTSSSRYTVSVFPNDRLFVPIDPDTTQLVTSVIGVTTSDNTNRSIDMRFTINQSLVDDFSELMCVFWDFKLAGGIGDWSNDGCQQLTTTPDTEDATNSVTCSCNHFTHFSVIKRVTDDGTVDEVKDKYAIFLIVTEIIAVIMMIMSVLFIILTVILYLRIWSSSSDKPSTNLFLNTCVSMVILYLVYIIAIYTRYGEPTACTVFAAILHYSFLVPVFSLMLECGFFTLRRYWVKIEQYSPIVVLIAWLIPVLIVIFCVAPGNHLYSSNNICLPRGAPFYIGVISPFVVIMCLSLCVVILSYFLSLKTKNPINKVHLVRLVAVSIIFSIGWTFALAEGNTSSGLTAGLLELMYSLTAGLLGVYIFVLHWLTQPNIRRTLSQKKENSVVRKNNSKGNVKGTMSLQRLTASLTRTNEEVDHSPTVVTNDGFFSQPNSPTKVPHKKSQESDVKESVDL